ncbi:MAG: hypothetical protein V2I36_00575 [Desulfopila sp.]|nr:hypothetical protein [Desulfopila sp.]
MREKVPSQRSNLHLTADDLIGRQSVRATFKLSQEVINLLSVIAAQLGIKKKSLFDQLLENSTVLEEIARKYPEHEYHSTARRQKTFVISRNSLELINQISQKQEVSRDFLVEMSIKRLSPVITSELAKHKKRKELQKEMVEYLHQGKRLLQKSADLLGKEDQLYIMLEDQISMAKRNLSTVNRLIKKGMLMEDM